MTHGTMGVGGGERMFLGLPNHKTRPCVVVHSYRSYFSGLAEPVLLSFSSYLEKQGYCRKQKTNSIEIARW